VFWYSLQILSETFLILRKIQHNTINVYRSSRKTPVILVRFQWNWNSLFTSPCSDGCWDDNVWWQWKQVKYSICLHYCTQQMKDAQDTNNQRKFSWWNYPYYLFCRTADLSKIFCLSFWWNMRPEKDNVWAHVCMYP
jgi:hypothetical protein